MKNGLQIDQKVFGIGLTKTGTTSLGKALEILGIRTMHYPNDEKTFAELMGGIYNLSILKNYQAIVDTPVVPFYPQLDKSYPESKFILTVREKNSWLKSIKNHWISSSSWSDHDRQAQKFQYFIRACDSGSIEFNKNRFHYVYDQHYKNVLNYFKNRPNDLLMMDISAGDGWSKLCTFLGLPIPNGPFPHQNKRKDIETWIKVLNKTMEDISIQMPSGVRYILVNDYKLGNTISSGQNVIPFLEKDGQYWGPPPEVNTAINELDRLRKAGAGFILVAWTSIWWFDYYAEFHEYLCSKYKCILENKRLIIFDLRQQL